MTKVAALDALGCGLSVLSCWWGLTNFLGIGSSPAGWERLHICWVCVELLCWLVYFSFMNPDGSCFPHQGTPSWFFFLPPGGWHYKRRSHGGSRPKIGNLILSISPFRFNQPALLGQLSIQLTLQSSIFLPNHVSLQTMLWGVHHWWLSQDPCQEISSVGDVYHSERWCKVNATPQR
jgi:hypothetical protein